MLILSRVCAEFHDETGATIYTVTPARRLTFVEAPDAIRGDPLFRMLVEDGSLEAVLHPDQQAVRALEQDPQQDADASGKRPASGRSRGGGKRASASPGEESLRERSE